jgi:catechol 2,3-dioxygenase-like lactoylglutathione lyase family enzyme
MSFINGLGGAFVFSNEPKRLANWYSENFGFEFDGSEEFGAFYKIFWAADTEDPARKLDTTFSIMRAKASFSREAPAEEPESMYGDQPFMVNLRTGDLESLLSHLEAKGVAVIKRQDEPYGKFAWVRDPDGNRVELYQPIEGETGD